MKKKVLMKHLVTFLVAILFVIMICSSSFADSVTLDDLSAATDEELEEARIKIVAEQRARIKTSIVFDSESLTITKGKNGRLKPSVVELPEGEKNPTKFVWTSSDESVVKCNNGNIKAVDGGEAVITCSAILSDGTEIFGNCPVTVIVPVSQIVYNNKPVSLKKGSSYKPTFSFKPDNASDTSLSFSSSDETIARVDSNGTITAVSVGKAKITAITNDGSNKKATISVEVVLEFPQTATSFKSRMMDSVSSQINEATDLTISGTNRAVLAALLTLEFTHQCPDKKIDYTMPIYVSKSGTIAATVFAIQDDYVMVAYQMHPLTTTYGFLGGKDAAMAKKALQMISDNVWTVPLNEYNQKLELLVQQIQ